MDEKIIIIKKKNIIYIYSVLLRLGWRMLEEEEEEEEEEEKMMMMFNSCPEGVQIIYKTGVNQTFRNLKRQIRQQKKSPRVTLSLNQVTNPNVMK